MSITNAQHIAFELASIYFMEKHGRLPKTLLEKRGTLQQFVRQQGPRGAGIDNGTYLDMDKSTSARIVLTCDYHHMNDVGFYDGWTEHRVWVKPAFGGLDIRVTGKDRNMINADIADVFDHWLMSAYIPNQETHDARNQITATE
jgi:hypothetical protein